MVDSAHLPDAWGQQDPGLSGQAPHYAVAPKGSCPPGEGVGHTMTRPLANHPPNPTRLVWCSLERMVGLFPGGTRENGVLSLFPLFPPVYVMFTLLVNRTLDRKSTRLNS